jgi:uncharacterized protein (TIGR00255 family)
MFGDDSLDIEALVPSCLALAKDALADFSASRAREGAKLAAVILERVERMRELVREVAPRIPAAQQAFQDKLKQRLVDAIGSADDERIRQEVAVFAVRIDVAEELARLSTHLDEVERVLKAGGASGKRLDFLMQELNREANTLGSKSVVTEVSQTAMELKLLIEQMREQIQNERLSLRSKQKSRLDRSATSAISSTSESSLPKWKHADIVRRRIENDIKPKMGK